MKRIYKNLLVRLIALTLILAVAFQNIAWAAPEIKGGDAPALQVFSIFDSDNPASDVMLSLKYVLTGADIDQLNLRVPLNPLTFEEAGYEDDFYVVLKFDEKKKRGDSWHVPCELIGVSYLWSYTAVITPGNKIYIMTKAGEVVAGGVLPAKTKSGAPETPAPPDGEEGYGTRGLADVTKPPDADGAEPPDQGAPLGMSTGRFMGAFWDWAIPRLRAIGLSDRMIAVLSGFEELIYSLLLVTGPAITGNLLFGTEGIPFGLLLGTFISAVIFRKEHSEQCYRFTGGVLIKGPVTSGDGSWYAVFQFVSRTAYFILTAYFFSKFGVNITSVSASLCAAFSVHGFYSGIVAPLAGVGTAMSASAGETGAPEDMRQIEKGLIERIKKAESRQLTDAPQFDSIKKITVKISNMGNALKPKTLKKELKQAYVMREARRVDWGEVSRLLARIADGHKIYMDDSMVFPSHTLGTDIMAFRSDIMGENEALARLVLVKEGYVLFSRVKGHDITAGQRQAKALLMAFAAYCVFNDNERNSLARYAHKYAFIKLFEGLYQQVTKKGGTDVTRPLNEYVLENYPEIETSGELAVAESDIRTFAENDLRDVFDRRFLIPGGENPAAVSKGDGFYLYERGAPALGKGVSIKLYHLTGVSGTGGEAKILEAEYKSENMVTGSLAISVMPDPVFGEKYACKLEGDRLIKAVTGQTLENFAGGPEGLYKSLPGQLMSFVAGILSALDGASIPKVEGFAAAVRAAADLTGHGYSFVETRAHAGAVGCYFVSGRIEEKLRIQAEERRQARLDRDAIWRTGQTSSRSHVFSLRDANIVIAPCGSDAETRRKTEGLVDGLRKIGFQRIRVVPDFVTYFDTLLYTSEYNVVVVVNPDQGNDREMDFADRARSFRKAKVFEWSAGGRVLSEIISAARYSTRTFDTERGHIGKYRSSPRDERLIVGDISPDTAAEYIARNVVPWLIEEGPIVSDSLTVLPEYTSEATGGMCRNSISVGIVDFQDTQARELKEGLKDKIVTMEAARVDRAGFSVDARILSGPDEALERSFDVYIMNWRGDYRGLWEQLTKKHPGSLIVMYSGQRNELGNALSGSRTEWVSQTDSRVDTGQAVDYAVSCMARLGDIRQKRQKAWSGTMLSRLQAADTYMQRSDAWDSLAAHMTSFTCDNKPSCKHVNKVPHVTFEGIEAAGTGGMRLKEEDNVTVTFKGAARVWTATVREVDDDRVVCVFPKSFSPMGDIPRENFACTIKKVHNDSSTRVQHAFLQDIMEMVFTDDAQARLEYPVAAVALGLEKVEIADESGKTGQVILRNRRIGANTQQLKLTAAALNGGTIELGWGPPGTGKTTNAGEIIYQNYCCGKSQVIAAQTNRAVDNLLLLAKDMGMKVYRVGRDPEIFDPGLREDWIYKDMPRKPERPPSDAIAEERRLFKDRMGKYHREYAEWEERVAKEIISGKAVVGGTCMGLALDPFVGILIDIQGQKKNNLISNHIEPGTKDRLIPFKFDRGILEEASVASFAELLITLGFLREKALIIGDHNQLGVSPMADDFKRFLATGNIPNEWATQSRAGAVFQGRENNLTHYQISALETSLFEFLVKQEAFNITMLEDCFRMTPLLVELANFNYRGKLRAMRDVPAEVNRHSLVVIDTKNIPKSMGNEDVRAGTSWFNEFEEEVVMDIMEGLGREAAVDTEWLGLVTPYRAQIDHYRNKLKRMIRQSAGGKAAFDRIGALMENVGTAYPFQGREEPVIVNSCVRSNTHGRTGFVDWKMWNVITTRGRNCLIVVLNSDTFLDSRKERVAEFVTHMLALAREKGVYVELTPQKPKPDLSETYRVLRKTLPKDYEGSIPLIPDGKEAPARFKGDTPFARADFSLGRFRELFGFPGKWGGAEPSPRDKANIVLRVFREAIEDSVRFKELSEDMLLAFNDDIGIHEAAFKDIDRFIEDLRRIVSYAGQKNELGSADTVEIGQVLKGAKGLLISDLAAVRLQPVTGMSGSVLEPVRKVISDVCGITDNPNMPEWAAEKRKETHLVFEKLRHMFGKTKEILSINSRKDGCFSEKLDVKAIKTGLMTDLSATIATGIDIQIEGDENMPDMGLDHSLIYKTCQNMLANAEKACFRARDRNMRAKLEIILKIEREGNGVKVSCIDNGMGIQDDEWGGLDIPGVIGRGTDRMYHSGLGIPQIIAYSKYHYGSVEIKPSGLTSSLGFLSGVKGTEVTATFYGKNPAGGDKAAASRRILDTHPVSLLRDLADDRQLAQSAREMLLAAALQRKKTTLAFDVTLGATCGFSPVDIFAAALEDLRKYSFLNKLLKNVEIVKFTPENAAGALRERIDKGEEVFAFVRGEGAGKGQLNALGGNKNLHTVLINETTGGREFPMGAYYPLIEIVTIVLAESLRIATLDNLLEGTTLKDLNIAAMNRSENGCIIVSLL
ncbi:MAG: AAA domain-containing protein, partial [Candidatus Omnitrophota bacterium]